MFFFNVTVAHRYFRFSLRTRDERHVPNFSNSFSFPFLDHTSSFTGFGRLAGVSEPERRCHCGVGPSRGSAGGVPEATVVQGERDFCLSAPRDDCHERELRELSSVFKETRNLALHII